MSAPNKPASVEEYLAALPEDQRAALEALRTVIKSAAPGATEGLSYGVPSFKHHGALVSFGAAKNHCAFYVQSPATMTQFAGDLAHYDTAKGTVRFTPTTPLPPELVRRLVAARIAENEAARRPAKKEK